MSTSCNSSSTLTQLQQLFPGVLLLNSRQTASVLNMPFKTLSNAGGDFPIKSIKFGPRKFYRLVDIAGHIDVLLGITNQPISATVAMPTTTPPVATSSSKRGRGRPRKGGVA